MPASKDKQHAYKHGVAALSTQELEALLRLDYDAAAPEEEDSEMVLAVLEELARREGESEGQMRTEQALEEWKTWYLPSQEEGGLPEQKSSSHATGRRKPLRLVGSFVAAAIVLFAGLGTAQAFGLDVFGALGRWTDETFRFYATEQVDAYWFAPYEEELTAASLNSRFLPTWIPERYTVEDFQIDQMKNYRILGVQLEDAEGNLADIHMFSLESAEMLEDYSIQKNDGSVENFESNGHLVYFFYNHEILNGTAVEGTTIITVTGDLSQGEMRQIFDSIRW